MFLLCPSLLLVALNFARLNFTNLHVTQIKRSVFNSIFNLLVFFCFICLSIYLSIFLSIYLSIYLSIDRSIDLSIYLYPLSFVSEDAITSIWHCLILAQCSISMPLESNRKLFDFLTFSGGIKIEHWAKMT